MYGSKLLALAGLLVAASALPAAVTTLYHLPNLDAIKSVNQSCFNEHQQGGLVRTHPITKRDLETRKACTAPGRSIFTFGDRDTGGPGIVVTNGVNIWEGFYIYENNCDSVPVKYFWLGPSQTQFISLPAGFQGRITRGTDALNLANRPQLLGILMWALDGSGGWKGFTHDILAHAPVGTWAQKPSGTWVLAPNEGSTADSITTQYELQSVGAWAAYIDDAHGNPVINSRNGRFGV